MITLDALNQLASMVRIDAQAHHLYKDYENLNETEKRKQLAMRITIETAEAYQAAHDFMHYREQLADVIIMALSAADYCGITDIGNAVAEKVEYNKTRPDMHRRPYNHNKGAKTE